MAAAQILVVLCCLFATGVPQYQPNWASIDSRPLPAWFDQSKIGIFLHWGLFSVPSYGSEWFWMYWRGNKSPQYVQFMTNNFRPDFTYPDFAKSFTGEFYDPQEWADIFEASGARYIVLTSKHHEGFTMWPSKVSWNWNAMDVGPRRDLLGELANAVRKNTNLHFGVYHSMFEWFHPLYLMDKKNNFTTQYFVEMKTMPELIELVETYQPEVIWSDGDWEAPDIYWNSTVFLAWLYNKSPVKDTVVVNDRWGAGIPCHHGGYFTCTDRYNPGKLQPRKWENAMTVDLGSWGYRRNTQLNSYITIENLIATLAQTISCGGNLLVNVGPTHDGRILPIFEERLRQMGQWLKVNGEAIYGTKPWAYQNDTVTPGVWYTSKENEDESITVYAIVLHWPKSSNLYLGDLSLPQGAIVTMLGFSGELSWKVPTYGGTYIAFPSLTPDLLPCQWAWVIKVVVPSFWNRKRDIFDV